MSAELETIFYAGQYNDVLSRTIEDPAFDCDRESIPWIVATLSMLGRSEEAAGFYTAYLDTLAAEQKVITRFYYALAICRERRIGQARKLFLENFDTVKMLVKDQTGSGALPQYRERLKFFAFQGLAFFRYSTGYYRQAHFWALKSVTATSAANYHHGSCLAHELYGHVQLQLGHVSAGMKNLEKALEKAVKLGQGAWTQTFAASVRLYRATYGLSNASQIAGELLESLAKCSYEDAYTKASLQIQLARIMTLTGDLLGAARLLEESSSLVYRLDNPYLETNYNLCLAYVQYLHGNYAIALSIAKNAEVRAKDRGYIPSALRSLGIQVQILEKMGMFKERLSILQGIKSLTLKTGGYIPMRILQRRDFLSTGGKRGEDPLGDLMDDVAAHRKDVVSDVLSRGWLSLLRSIVRAEPGQKLIVFDLENNSLSMFHQGHVTHRTEGCSILIKKLLLSLSDAQELTKEEITHTLWAQSYNPLRHDTLIYGLIARTRKLVQPFSEWIEVTESGYRLAEGVVIRNGRHMNSVSQPEVTSAAEITHIPANFADLNLRQIEIIDIAKQGAKIVPKEMSGRFDVSDATMTRDLARLVESGFLKRFGAGRSTFYMSSPE